MNYRNMLLEKARKMNKHQARWEKIKKAKKWQRSEILRKSMGFTKIEWNAIHKLINSKKCQ